MDNIETLLNLIDNQKDINRLLEAIKNLKKKYEDDIADIRKEIDSLSDKRIKEILRESSEDICLYSIQEGEWYFNNKPTGIKAIGKDGQDGKDGKNGLNGLPGKDGKNGKDINLRIGNVETSDDGEVHAKLRKEKEITYLDLKLPRGPQGFMGFDAKINGKNSIEIQGSSSIDVVQKNDELLLKIDESFLKYFVKETLKEEGLLDSSLTLIEIEALNNMICEIDENGELLINYDDEVLNISFSIEDKNLIVTENIDANFSINENGEMEVSY